MNRKLALVIALTATACGDTDVPRADWTCASFGMGRAAVVAACAAGAVPGPGRDNASGIFNVRFMGQGAEMSVQFGGDNRVSLLLVTVAKSAECGAVEEQLRQAFGAPRPSRIGIVYFDVARRQAIAGKTGEASCAFLVTRSPM